MTPEENIKAKEAKFSHPGLTNEERRKIKKSIAKRKRQLKCQTKTS